MSGETVNQYPRRAYQVEVHADGHTVDDVVRLLEEFVGYIKRGCHGNRLIAGGDSGS
jgi:hypothetical protein